MTGAAWEREAPAAGQMCQSKTAPTLAGFLGCIQIDDFRLKSEAQCSLKDRWALNAPGVAIRRPGVAIQFIQHSDERHACCEHWPPSTQARGSVPTSCAGLVSAVRRLTDNADDPTELDDLSVAYVDSSGRRLLLYRGLCSRSTIYYRISGRFFMWSTHPGPVIEGHRLTQIDHALIPALIADETVAPESSLYAAVKRLPLGHLLTVSPSGLSVRVHGDFARLSAPNSLSDAVDHARELISDAVRRHVIAAARVGVLVSGGLDSAIVARSAASATPSVAAFHWSKRGLPVADESHFARLVASHVGVPDTEIEVGSDSFAALAIDSRRPLPLPWTGPYQSWYEALARAVEQQDIDLVLTGGLADHIFGTPLRFASLQIGGMPPGSALRAAIEWLGTPLPFASLAPFGLLGQRAQTLESLAQSRFRDLAASFLSPHGYRLLLERGGYTYRGNRGSTAADFSYHAIRSSFEKERELLLDELAASHGFRIAHPLGDRRVVEFGLSLYPWMRVMAGGGRLFDKPLLRLAFANSVPREVLGRNAGPWLVALAAQYCIANVGRIAELLGPRSLLREMGLLLDLPEESLRAQLATRPGLAVPLISAVKIESWLRALKA